MCLQQHRSKKQKILITLTICVFSFYSAAAGSVANTTAKEAAPIENDVNETESLRQNPGNDQKDLEQVSDQLERLFEDFRKLNQESSAKIWDGETVIAGTGSDNPEGLFEWVRDNTYFIPYEGLLRGSEGVLMDRLGNSLDRALLLHDLLSLAGYDTRLANGTLSSEQAENVLKKTHVIPKDLFSLTYAPLSESDRNLIDRYSREYNVDKKTLLQAVKEKESRDRQLIQNLSKKVNSLMTKISDLIDEPENTREENQKIFKSIQDHWWVQISRESGWLDLDPTLPESTPGETLTEARNTGRPDSIDESVKHRVTIKIVIEQWKKGTREEHVVLSHSIEPSDHLGQKITFYHTSGEWSGDLNILEERDPQKSLENLILQQETWTPILQIGSDKIKNLSFKNSGETTTGEEEKKRPSGPAGIMGGFGRSVSGAKPKTEEAKDSFLTAEWIEYEILLLW